MNKKKKGKGWKALMALLALAAAFVPGFSARAEGSLLDSPYVVPYYYTDTDGTTSKYFTISQPQPIDYSRGETSYVYHNYEEYIKSGTMPSYWIPDGTTVETGIASSLRELEIGEHYYNMDRIGEVPIGKWVVQHTPGWCIHTGNQKYEWQGLSVGDSICRGAYFSGWLCYCADCGRLLLNALVYSPQDRIETIDYMNMDYGYYYICQNPECHHLENEGYAQPHTCKLISPNRYKVVYDANGAIPVGNGYADISGYMQPSFHMYDNATEYEGNPIEPVTHLNECTYTRRSYTFTGWNTKPDGSGESFADGAEIFNLSEYNYLDIDGIEDSRGVITLYAQWKLTVSSLRIDPADGKYDGKPGFTDVKQGYGTNYLADPDLVTVDPKNKVSYNTNGGGFIEPTKVPRQFSSWKQGMPFKGQMRENTYYFTAPDGNVDLLTAQYENLEILLPTPTKPDSSFGGWYEDPECETKPVGFGGDPYLAKTDVTLYAKWVNLTLWSFDNYTDNHRKGAADLRWTEPDDWIKTYILYRSDDSVNFTQINSMDGGTAITDSGKDYDYTGTTKTYTVPSTGFYQITAYGAQGKDYGGKTGGRGGSVTAKVYLKKGEVLTIAVGGQNGFNGGGTAEKYGNGGGATTVKGSSLGTILVAGGGGGATEYANGEAGGLETALREDNSSVGEHGDAGGGGGYVGGKSGATMEHHHTEECLITHEHVPECFHETKEERTCNITPRGYLAGSGRAHYCITNNAAATWIYMHYNAAHDACGCPNWGGQCANDDYGQCFNNAGYYCCNSCGSRTCGGNRETVFGGFSGGLTSHKYYVKVQTAVCGLEEGINCKYGYGEGQMVSSTNAYGGGSYATDKAVSSSSEAGIREGNGYVRIDPVQVGMADGLELKAVEAPDLVAPDAVEFHELRPVSNVLIEVSWEEPIDHGTQYWFKCESYNALTGDKLCDSNVTSNVLTTGVAGYYYVYDADPTTLVTPANADNRSSLLTETKAVCLAQAEARYFHVAPIDVAGNLGDTRHVEIIANGHYDWPVMTDQVIVTSVIDGRDYESVYTDPNSGRIYVNGSGTLPFKLSFGSCINGYASDDYQITVQELFVNLDVEGKSQAFQTVVPLSADPSADQNLPVSQFVRSVSGEALISDVSRTGGGRTSAGTRNSFWQAFSAPETLHGKTVVVTPGAAIEEMGMHSDWDDDVTHSARFILDGVAPTFTVNQDLESLTAINADTLEDLHIVFTASDDLSGLKKFAVKAINQDNGDTRTYYDDGDGKVSITFDPASHLFDGDVVFELAAWDNVSNKGEKTLGKAEYTMTAEIVHSGYNPAGADTYRRGDPALLHVMTTGYADTIRIQVPPEIEPGYPSDQVDFYGLTTYRTILDVNFAVPYSCPPGNYGFIVHSYKNGEELEARPVMITIIDDPVGSDVRVRIR